MKILVISPSYLPDKRAGGSVSGCHEFVKTLNKRFNVNVLTFNTLDDDVTNRLIDDIAVRYLPRSKAFDIFSSHGWHFSISYLFYLKKILKQFDTVYFRSVWNFPSLAGFIICSLSRKPFIVCSSGKFSKYALRTGRIKKKIAFFLLSVFICNARAIHYASIDEYENVAIKKIKRLPKLIVPNAITEAKSVEREESANTLESRRVRFYTVSRLNKIKNLEYVIQTLAKQNYECELNIVGDGEYNYVQQLQNYADEYVTINKNLSVNFHGFQPRCWVDKEFYDCIFLQASFSEGFSNSVLEAIARGSVTCVSKQCNMTSLSSDGLLSEFDIETNELDALLADIHCNLSHYEERAKAASEKVLEMYSAEKLACRLETQLRGI